MDEQILKVLSRIKATDDGQDLIELIRRLSQNNYKQWKQNTQEFNDVHKGQAIALDELLSLFENCEQKLLVKEIKETNEWM